MITNYTLRVVDAAAQVRELFGDQADFVCGRQLPDHEWRLEVTTPDGYACTYPIDATAADVAADLAEYAVRRRS